MHSCCQGTWKGALGVSGGLRLQGNSVSMGQARLDGNQSEGPEDGLRISLPQNSGDPAWWGWGSACGGGGPGGGDFAGAAIWGACLLSSRRSPRVTRSQGEDPEEKW